MGEGRDISYATLVDTAGRIASLIIARGMVLGDRAAVQTEKTPDAVMLYLACLMAGVVHVPLNTA